MTAVGADRLVTVVMPVHDGERFLGQAIASVLAQDHQVELIVVDDGSTDSTAAVVRSFPGVRYLWQPNQGPSAARNAGMAVAEGAFLAFCDHDDLYLPHKLSRQLSHLDERPAVGCVQARQDVFFEPGTPQPPWLIRDPVFGDLGGVEPLSCLVRREAVERAGGFTPGLRLAEGFDWLVRLRQAGVAVEVIPEKLVRRRIHPGNASHGHPDGTAVRLQVLKRALEQRRSAPTR